MKKKEILKEQKRLKEEKNRTYLDFGDDSTTKKVLYISGGVVLFILATFVLINIFNGTWNLFKRENTVPTEIDPKLLMCGTMFDAVDSEYYVLAYKMNNEEDELYNMLRSNYSGKNPLYYLDLESGFNKGCVSDKSNLVNDVSKLTFNTQTLLHIKKGKIVKSYTKKDQIKEVLLAK